MIGTEGITCNGAFTAGAWHSNWNKGHNSGNALNSVNFNASNSNNIYGSGKTVIPLSRKCLFLVKY